MNSQEKPTHTPAAAPDRLAVAAELEATRQAFHALLDSLSDADLRRKSPTSAWTIGEILVHVTWSLEQLPAEVQHARHSQDMFNVPQWITDPLSFLFIRWTARRVSRRALARRYDAAIDAAHALLNMIQESDWSHGARFYSEGYHTVADLFHSPAHHFAEHTTGL